LFNFCNRRNFSSKSDLFSKFIAWTGIIFFGLGYPLALFQLLDRRPQIIVNELGIFDRTTHKDFINWEIIQDAYLAEAQGQRFICLVVAQQFEPSSSKGKATKKLAEFSKALGFQELNISLGNVKVNAGRLKDFILAMRMAERPNREALVREISQNMR
jgi:hypothetical protein